MTQFEDNLDQLLDVWTVQPLDRDLTSQILTRARLEDEQFEHVLAAAASIEPLQRDLAGPIMRTIRRQKHRRRLVAWIGPLAAAAAIALVATVWMSQHKTATVVQPPQVAASLTAEEKQVAGNLDVVRDYLACKYWDEIREMERLEQAESVQPANDATPSGDGSST